MSVWVSNENKKSVNNLSILCQCVEEILGFLKSCFSREPTMATVCVQQVSHFCVFISEV